MDVKTTAQVSSPQHRTTTAIGDRDVGQKGRYFHRRPGNKSSSTPKKSPKTRQTGNGSHHTIDIQV